MENEEIKPVVVFTGTMIEVSILKTIMEDAEIESYLKDQAVGTLGPWITGLGGIGSVKLLVSSLDLEKAKFIVDEFLKNEKKDIE